MKLIYKILMIAAGVIILGFGGYFLWKKLTAPPPLVAPLETRATSTIPAVVEKSPLMKLSDTPVFDFVVGETGEVFYFTPDGFVFTAKQDKDLVLSKQKINALNSVSFSLDRKKILAAFGDPRSPEWGIFDLVDKVWRPLPNEMALATWGKDSNELIATVKKGVELPLVTLDISKTPPVSKVLLKDVRFKDVHFVFRAPQSLLIIEKPSALYQSSVWEFDTKKLTLTLLVQRERGMVLEWSHDRSVIFQFVSPNSFRILNANFEEQTPLFFTTFPSKCTAADVIAYCFSPQELPQELPNLLLPDDYFQNRFYTVDELYKINLSTETITPLMKSDSGILPPLDAKNPRYADGKIYFINRYDSFLYAFSL